MMKKIKTITSPTPKFLDETFKHDALLDLCSDERQVKVGEKFIRFVDGRWMVYKMPKERMPRLCGRFDYLIKAVYRARLTI